MKTSLERKNSNTLFFRIVFGLFSLCSTEVNSRAILTPKSGKTEKVIQKRHTESWPESWPESFQKFTGKTRFDLFLTLFWLVLGCLARKYTRKSLLFEDEDVFLKSYFWGRSASSQRMFKDRFHLGIWLIFTTEKIGIELGKT